VLGRGGWGGGGLTTEEGLSPISPKLTSKPMDLERCENLNTAISDGKRRGWGGAGRGGVTMSSMCLDFCGGNMHRG